MVERLAAADVLQHLVQDRAWHRALASLSDHLAADGLFVILDCMSEEFRSKDVHCNRRSLARYAVVLDTLGLRVVEHERFRLEPEGVTKDLLAIRRTR